MFLLGIQNNFYIILSSYVEGQLKKTNKQTNRQTNYTKISCLQLVSWPQKSVGFFGTFTVEQVLKSFSGRNVP